MINNQHWSILPDAKSAAGIAASNLAGYMIILFTVYKLILFTYMFCFCLPLICTHNLHNCM